MYLAVGYKKSVKLLVYLFLFAAPENDRYTQNKHEAVHAREREPSQLILYICLEISQVSE